MNISVKAPQDFKRAQDFLAKSHRHLIDGQWVDSVSGKTFDVYDPSNGQLISRVAAGDKEDIDRAVRAARKAFDSGPWSKMTAAERSKLIMRLAAAIDAIGDEMAFIETFDNGRPFRFSRSEHVGNAVAVFEYYAGWATKLSGSTLDIAAPGEYHTYTLREPVGVAGLIVAWNVPLQIAASKLAPALAAGCTAVLKPAEQTPLSALRLGELIQEIGFPPGVINIVNGVGASAGAALVEHPDVDKISFTGSTETGRRILNAATGNFKRVTLELGGKSPVVIFPDADMSLSIPAAASGVFHNSGQVCAAGTRLFAHKKVFDQVVEGIAAQAKQLKVGPGLDETSDLGPLVSKTQLDRVVGYMDAGAKDGAKIVTGGKSIERDGYYVQPTVFTDTTLDMSIRREEIFGPVLCAMSFDDTDLDAIAAEANNSIHGLSARIFTRDISTAHKMARRLKAGSVRINGGVPDMNVPFGGYKQSGWGREGGREGVESYTEIKTVIVRL